MKIHAAVPSALLPQELSNGCAVSLEPTDTDAEERERFAG
jgi:hypothetical protein